MAETGRARGRPSIIGIGRGVGPLEARVLRAPSEEDRPLSVREVCDHLSRGGNVAYQGVLNCMNRVVSKGLLGRTLERNAYVYRLRMDLEELTARVLADATAQMGADLDRVICRLLGTGPDEGAPELARRKRKSRFTMRRRNS